MCDLYYSIKLHAQMNIGFYGHSVHGACSCADGLVGYDLVWCDGKKKLFCVINATLTIIMLALFAMEP